MKNENFEIVIVQNQSDFDEVMKIRRKVFVEEQGIPADKEFDGNDFTSTHLLAKIDGVSVGTMRIRYFADFVKFERMAVLQEYRQTSVSNDIMNKGFEFVAHKGYQQVYGVCKKELLKRWERCGYEQIEGAPLLQHNGMELIPIKRQLSKDKQSLGIYSHPHLLTMREDSWNDTSVAITNNKLIYQKQNKEKSF